MLVAWMWRVEGSFIRFENLRTNLVSMLLSAVLYTLCERLEVIVIVKSLGCICLGGDFRGVVQTPFPFHKIAAQENRTPRTVIDGV